MIVRGIVSEEALQQIKSAAAHHGLNKNKSGCFQVWRADGAIWVEVDVNEGLMEYLQGSGFFDGLEHSKTKRKEENQS